MKKKEMTFTEVLESEFYYLVEHIEELISAEEPALLEIRSALIAELKAKTGFEYIIN